MPKTRPPDTPEFRRQMVDLVHAGRDPTALARAFEPSAQAIRNGVATADRQSRRKTEPVVDSTVLTAPEKEEPLGLRRGNKPLRWERDILPRATAGFARETGVIPSGSSPS